jgi:hypothetical protein
VTKPASRVSTLRQALLGLLALLSTAIGSTPARAETVLVKYRGAVDLKSFNCQWIERSSFIRRLCYDDGHKYVLVSLNGTYYHYCGVPAAVVDDWLASSSMGRFYNASVKGRFDCRVTPPPDYAR